MKQVYAIRHYRLVHWHLFSSHHVCFYVGETANVVLPVKLIQCRVEDDITTHTGSTISVNVEPDGIWFDECNGFTKIILQSCCTDDAGTYHVLELRWTEEEPVPAPPFGLTA